MLFVGRCWFPELELSAGLPTPLDDRVLFTSDCLRLDGRGIDKISRGTTAPPLRYYLDHPRIVWIAPPSVSSVLHPPMNFPSCHEMSNGWKILSAFATRKAERLKCYFNRNFCVFHENSGIDVSTVDVRVVVPSGGLCAWTEVSSQ